MLCNVNLLCVYKSLALPLVAELFCFFQEVRVSDMRNTISDMAIIMSRGPMIEPSTMLSVLEGLGEGRIGIAGETVGGITLTGVGVEVKGASLIAVEDIRTCTKLFTGVCAIEDICM